LASLRAITSIFIVIQNEAQQNALRVALLLGSDNDSKLTTLKDRIDMLQAPCIFCSRPTLVLFARKERVISAFVSLLTCHVDCCRLNSTLD